MCLVRKLVANTSSEHKILNFSFKESRETHAYWKYCLVFVLATGELHEANVLRFRYLKEMRGEWNTEPRGGSIYIAERAEDAPYVSVVRHFGVRAALLRPYESRGLS
jgi:hypothetical protein